MLKRRIFLSYDTQHDERLREFFAKLSQRPDAPFEITGFSTIPAGPARTWALKTSQAIHGCEILVVLVGPHTHKAAGVLQEVDIAQDEEIPILQIIGYKDQKFNPVPGAGRLFPWNWENVKQLFFM